MTLDLVRRSTKGSPLTATDHDGNLDKLEQAIEAIDPADFATAAQGALADTAIQPGDPALTDAREWTAETIDQAEAEDGTATTRRAFTAQRVFQAVAAWWAASAAKTKLDGIASGATANSSDAALLNRENHTGTQTAGTITGLASVATSGAYADLSGTPTLGTAAATDASAYATAAQGAKADTAVQPAALSGYVQTTDSRLTTDLTYDAATREVRSSTGADATLPLVTASAAGLVPAFTSATGKVFTDGGWATPSAGAPGGSNGQLQFNNNGAFGGVSTLTTDGSGNLTFSGRWINSRNGAANEPASALTGTWFTGGTATTTKPQFLIEPAGTTSTAWSTNGTGFGLNAPSGFLGNLFDAQVNASSLFRIAASGALTCASGGTFVFGVSASSFSAADSNRFTWSSGDIAIYRGSSSAIEIRNAATPTSATGLRIYNTFTSATNFERLNVRWTSNEAIIDTEAGSGGGTLRGLKIGSAGTSLLGFYGATPAVQPAAVANATDASTVITQLNALLSRLRNIGIIAT